MFHFVLVVALLSCVNASTSPRRVPRLDGKIVGGTIVDISSHPYQVSVEIEGEHGCGGSIISDVFVVTAAHCTFSFSEEDIAVRAGTSFYEVGGSVIQVSAINQHPDYDDPTYDYDISVLKLASPLSFSNVIAPIALASENQEFEPGTYAVITGWGRTVYGGNLSAQLQAVTVPLISHSDCQSLYIHDKITDRMLCAGYMEGGKDACQGDSGGPMVIDGILFGITSWGTGCAQPNQPGVYASVSKLRSYIAQVSGI